MGATRLSRRQFLIGAAAVLSGAALALARRSARHPARASGLTLTPQAYLPLVARGYSPYFARVIHVHGESATHWSGESAFWEHVDQQVVNEMVARGVMALTRTATVADAWRALLPLYQPGQGIAVKVNFNSTLHCNDVKSIGALSQLVNAVVVGLEQIGVTRSDVWVYDATRALPDWFVGGGLEGVRYFDRSPRGVCRNPAGFSQNAASQIAFYPPPGVSVPAEYVTDVVMNAAYLINMPIMKGGHPLAGVTLGFKNHLGTIQDPYGLHTLLDVVHRPPGYRTDYNPMVDLLRSPLVGGKTVLTIGDGLFASKTVDGPPTPWATFEGKVPNSLFFSRDPVAVDCVMHDFLLAEPGTNVPDGANQYLRLAMEAGLGVFESVNPHTTPYEQVDYVRVEV